MDGGLGGEGSGVEDVPFRAGDGNKAPRLGGVLVIRLFRGRGGRGWVRSCHGHIQVEERGKVIRGIL